MPLVRAHKDNATAAQVAAALRKKARQEKARILSSFFKAGPGEYGEGDVFLGVTVPEQRETARSFRTLRLGETKALLMSSVHEHRLTALLILVEQFKAAPEGTRKELVDFYLGHTRFVNNWDLVDLSANHILGLFLLNRKRDVLDRLSSSPLLWERRIAIVATFAFIRQNDFRDTLRIAKALLHDDHDLIHKAVGWMLREVGKRDTKTLEAFLGKHASIMPRTMLRYAIERLPETKRKAYLDTFGPRRKYPRPGV